MKNRVILFDLDGTLIDSTEAILESFGHAYTQMGSPAPHEVEIKALIGYPLDVMFAKLGASEPEAFVTHYKTHYRTISKPKTTLLPLAREAVMEASKFARLGVVTTKTKRYSIELLEHLGLMSYFEVVIGREDVTHPKPHPEPILKAIEAMGVELLQCVMIGDTCLDIEASQAAGIDSIGVLSGYGTLGALKACADTITQTALEAVQTIRGR